MREKKDIITDKNVMKYASDIETWIKDQVAESNTDGIVLGMSGGVDSSTVARLCQEVGIKVHLIILPYGENMKNSKTYSNAMELINKFKFEYHIFDIKTAVDALVIQSEDKTNRAELAKANIRPRIRMTYLYEYAQINNLLVIGTGNLSEATVRIFYKMGGWCTRHKPIS